MLEINRDGVECDAAYFTKPMLWVYTSSAEPHAAHLSDLTGPRPISCVLRLPTFGIGTISGILIKGEMEQVEQ